MALTQGQKDKVVEVIRGLQEVQVRLEQKNRRTRDVELSDDVEALADLTGELSTVLNPAGSDTHGAPGPGPETAEPQTGKAPDTETGSKGKP